MSYKKSWEIFGEIFQWGDGKRLAYKLGVTSDAVTRWGRNPEKSDVSYNNPLDRLASLIDLIKETDGVPNRAYPICVWLAELLGGTFVPHSPVKSNVDNGALLHIAAVLHEASEVVESMRMAYFEQSPGKITTAERAQIFKEINSAIQALLSLKSWIDKQ